MILRENFGTARGKRIEKFILKNANIEMEIITYGGAIRTLKVPDINGNKVDVVLGFNDIDSYLNSAGSLGALIGRVGNRIERGEFTLNGTKYHLPINNGINSLHGGILGFDKRVWDAEIEGEKLKLTYFSRDGEEGYPGNLKVAVYYSLLDDGVKIEYFAKADKDTIINLTNHSYFNLDGEGSGDVLDTLIMIDADFITPVDENLVPHGEFMEVANTPFDLRALTPIKAKIDKPHKVMQNCNGFDTNFCINGEGYRLCALAKSEKSGIILECWTDQKGVQLYTGNFLDGLKGKTNKYNSREGFCLETQNYPNAINCPTYPSPILRVGQTYKTTTAFKFKLTK